VKQEMMGWQWHQLDHMQIICTLLQTDNHTSSAPQLSKYWRHLCRSDAATSSWNDGMCLHTTQRHKNQTVCTVKLRYSGLLGTGLRGPLYSKSVISKIGYGRLSRLGIFTVKLYWPTDSLHNCLASPWQWLTVC